ATPYFPAGTVFVAVVDPGVGSSRKALVAKSKAGQFFVLPDNGLLTMVAERDGIEAAREIANPAWMIGAALSSTFHGRDIFSPAGAHLARGDDWNAVGPEIAPSELVRLAVPQVTISGHTLRGIVVATDGPFGNLVTNIAVADFAKLGVQRGQKLHLVVGVRELDAPLVKTFSDVAIGQPLVYIDSRGRVAVALNQGNFAETYQVKPPVAMSLTVPPGK
ncbi:MAG: SAM-dependent chlorinase/fluorinase, partial [Acidobacteriales bacterium]|nr:SAM-dependent chlorinase/fluorinase [Terriglobales bacterium]